MTKYEYNKQYVANNRDLVNQRRREKYQQDKLNNPVDKPKQIRRRKPIEDKKTVDIKAYQKEYRLKNKEKIAEKQKEYVEKNKEHINKLKSEWKKNNPKPKKEKIIKPKQEKIKPLKFKVEKQKNYLDNTELHQQLVISKAQGKSTPELNKMLMLISENAVKKLKFYNPIDKDDAIQEANLQLLINYKYYNADKFTNALAYCTQIAKVGYVQSYNKIYYRKQFSIPGSKKKEFIQLKVTNCDWSSVGYNF